MRAALSGTRRAQLNGLPLYLLFLFISIIFLLVNVTCALLVKMTKADRETVVLVRVAINDTLFVLCAVSLSMCLYKIAKMSLANIYLESKFLNPGNEQTIH
ncbi:integral membrane protein GPR137B [Labeo rohita]|uniref:Integral membrane protein GPR137B n=1 Tax=Labeo rohita TaxID=84645 RepID=A0A498LD34_LABRO|nr:integral membrane protein GPR137B [Labeo rohita]